MTRSRFETPLVNAKEDVEYFGANPKLQQKLKWSDDPAERAQYESLHKDWKAFKGISNPRDKWQAVRAQWNKDAGLPQYSEEELLAQARWPQAEARTYSGNLADLKANDPRAYYQLELARSLYGLPGSMSVEENLQRLRNVAQVPETKIEPTFQPSREMISRLGLPDQRVSIETFNSAIAALNKLDEEAKAKQVSEKARQTIEQEDAAKVGSET